MKQEILRQNENIEFAPVLIPTLCRYQHFRKCLLSLSECTGADKTEVYIALDYPAKKEHEEGYLQIKTFLSEIGNLTFKKIHVIVREHNVGLGINGNIEQLRRSVLMSYDRCICSEDDNVFSPNFLVYINKGLTKFENDNSVFAICGYSHPYDIKYADNNYFMQNVDFSAWGYGIWKNRLEDSYAYQNVSVLRGCINIKSLWKVYCHGLNRLRDLYYFLKTPGKSKILYTDNFLSIYMILTNKNVIMPIITKVRNEGWDGTGENCKMGEALSNIHQKRDIDTDFNFDFVGNGKNFYKYNKKIFVRQSYGRIKLWELACKVLKKCIK